MNVISPDDLHRGLMDPNTAQKKAEISGVLPVYKEWGKTPLQTLDTLRADFPTLKDATLSYAGRLDPLAEGLMLVLVGEANKQREEYLGLDKTYEIEILFGIKTDTGDLLGVPTMTQSDVSVISSDELNLKFKSRNDEGRTVVAGELRHLLGKQSFPYPIYSSKTVQGKPLHQWANEGRISEIEIPKTDIEIYDLEILPASNVEPVRFASASEILSRLETAISLVTGEFRFDKIKGEWDSLCAPLQSKEEVRFPVLKIKCHCSSGTYMRTLAEEIGKLFGVSAFAYSIKRTTVGDIMLSESLK